MNRQPGSQLSLLASLALLGCFLLGMGTSYFLCSMYPEQRRLDPLPLSDVESILVSIAPTNGPDDIPAFPVPERLWPKVVATVLFAEPIPNTDEGPWPDYQVLGEIVLKYRGGNSTTLALYYGPEDRVMICNADECFLGGISVDVFDELRNAHEEFLKTKQLPAKE